MSVRSHGHPVPVARGELPGDHPGARRCLSPHLVIRGGIRRGAGRPRPRRRRRCGRPTSWRWPSPSARPPARWCSTPTGCLVGPGLVDLHTHLPAPARATRRPRRSSPAPGRPRSGATPPWSPCPTRSRPSTPPAWPPRCWRSGSGCTAGVAVAGELPSRSGGPASPLARAGQAGQRWASRSSPTTGPACRTARSCVAPSTTPRVSGSRWPSTVRTSASPMGAPCTRGPGRAGSASPLGMPAAAGGHEVARDISLSRLTGAPMHFLHMSTAGSVDLIRRAKAEGLAVTAEAAPHRCSSPTPWWPATTPSSR